LDGKLTSRGNISDSIDFERVYMLRSAVDGILVGANTIIKDNPLLTAKGRGKDPRPVILDRQAIIPIDAAILMRDPIIISSRPRGMKGEIITGDFSWNNIRKGLAEAGFHKILVEGGGRVIRSLIGERAWDEFFIYYAPVFGGSQEVGFINGPLEKSMKARIDSVTRQGAGFLVRLLPD
jgi:riboflavin biosynthesis pyrimidine reductase